MTFIKGNTYGHPTQTTLNKHSYLNIKDIHILYNYAKI